MTDETTTGSDVSKLSLARRVRNFADDYLPQGRWLSIALAGSAVYLILVVILGMYWSMTPAQFDVMEQARGYDSGAEPLVTGAVTTSALLGVVDTMLSKPGGYLHNDRFPPGVYLDNIPSWEYGALIQSRDLVRAMREFFSRSQSQSKEDPDLSKAEPLLNFQST
ncbi:DUF2333 family protein, partial [Congregibacter sp.]|uniref:DUF2333 family protein n=1 Tax=Congregibacter sp. TaxID=2744308 RepID=UPI003F6CBE87